MAFVFPRNPEIGDAYASGGASYFWNGDIWERGVGLVKPFLTALIPDEGPVNDPSIAVRIVGGNFKPDSEVYWDASLMPTTFVSDVELNVTAPSAPLASVADVSVAQDAGLMTSNALEFTYLQPAPVIFALEPNTSPTGQATPVRVDGANFTANSEVVFDGAIMATTFVSAAELGFTTPIQNAAKSCVVTVVDGVLFSNSVPFNYLVQTMRLEAIAPSSAASSAGQTEVHFLGWGFHAALHIVMGNTDVSPVTFVNDGDLWTWIFPSTWNMGQPATPGDKPMCYLFDLATGEVTNSLPFTFT